MSPERWQQIARLFDEVVELGPQQRAAFLDKACAGDEALRTEVESLLAARENAGAFLDEPAFELEARQAAAQSAVPAGQLIAHFEVLAPLGAGAMGEVYLARDTRLGRQVALKLLPLHFTQDASRLRRFEREARAASSLNHPNIIMVFEIGRGATPEGERQYIATEYVEGLTLRERLGQSALPLKEALAIASQIAAALAAAHASGIVHRDIKPENVMLRPDGVAKVLDFGIAKLTQRAAQSSDSGAHVAQHSTVQGTVIGTPGYMSPEQARGLDVDARTDIFSLGVVLYEMIAGQLPFRGTTNADAMVSLLEHEPDPITVCAPDTPDEVEEIVTQALAKECGQRYQTIQELQAALLTVQQQLEQPGYRGRVFSPKKLLRRFLGARKRSSNQMRKTRLGLAFLFGSIVALAAVWYFVVRPPKARLFENASWKTSQLASYKVGAKGWLSRVYFSPDGKRIAYNLDDERGGSIWVKHPDSGPQRLTDGKWQDRHPVWSPDGEKLAFFSNRDNKPGLWTISASGGEPAYVCELPLSVNYSVGWFRDHRGERIYFVYNRDPNNLQMVDLKTGEISQLTHFANVVRDFSVSPDERQIAYSQTVGSLSQIMIQALPAGKPEQVAVDEGSLRFPVWFPDSQILAYGAIRSGIYQIYLTNIADKKATQITLSESDLELSAVSPDGSRLIGRSRKQSANIWAWDLPTGTESDQTSELGSQLFPVVSPSGKDFVYVDVKDEVQAGEVILIKSLTQQNQGTPLTHGFGSQWSPDGSTLLFLRRTSRKSGLWTLDVTSQTPRELVPDHVSPSDRSFVPANLGADTYNWSPDSRAIAYCTNVSGVHNLWVMAKDGSDKRQITNNSAPLTSIYSPIWSPDNHLAYFSSVKDAATNKRQYSLYVYRAGKPEVVFNSNDYFRLIGWSASGQEIFLASGMDTAEPMDFQLHSVAVASGQPKLLAQLKAVYLDSIRLSPDRQHFAFVSRNTGKDNLKDNLEELPVTSRKSRKVTNNSDTDVYYSGLSWAPDGKKLFYSKQRSGLAVTMIERLP